jgi:valyl-tRNA synthetase
MGREAFIDKVWEWKAESGGLIFNQLKRLGASCDWSRERFTMDEGLSEAVSRSSSALQAGPDLQGQAPGQLGPEAADRDLRSRSRAGRGQGQPLASALSARRARAFNPDDPTTSSPSRPRGPETMLGDTGVAVNPDDERYKGHLIGKHVILPLVGRLIPIVADEYSDPRRAPAR